MTEPAVEYRVVWRWKTNPYHDEFSTERRKIYRTRRGADQLLFKLLKNDGKYDWYSDDPNDRGFDGEPTVAHWQLDRVRLEIREVGEWATATFPVAKIP